jgi:hypothetical protein
MGYPVSTSQFSYVTLSITSALFEGHGSLFNFASGSLDPTLIEDVTTESNPGLEATLLQVIVEW